MCPTLPKIVRPILPIAIAVLWALVVILSPAPSSACSITSSGTCGGSECPTGQQCKKTSDFECSCVSELAAWQECAEAEQLCQLGPNDWACWPQDAPCPQQQAARGLALCSAGEQRCALGSEDSICWPGDEACPSSTSGSADARFCPPGERQCQIHEHVWFCVPFEKPCPDPITPIVSEQTAFQVAVSSREVGDLGTARGTQKVTLRVTGCNGCFNSQTVTLPGNIKEVGLLSSQLTGGANYTGLHWVGDTAFEKSCFGTPSVACGSVTRTYLIAYE